LAQELSGISVRIFKVAQILRTTVKSAVNCCCVAGSTVSDVWRDE